MVDVGYIQCEGNVYILVGPKHAAVPVRGRLFPHLVLLTKRLDKLESAGNIKLWN
jgi:hypothetical protein